MLRISILLLNFRSEKSSVTYAAPCQKVYIRQINNENHPAFGQSGLFAAQHLPPDVFILPYLGCVHNEQDTDDTSDYDLSLDREIGISVDAAKLGNEARFINDYRGVSMRPNAEFRNVWIDFGKKRVEQTIGIFVLPSGKSGKKSKGVVKGEEILVSYGKGFWQSRASVD